ncbi:MAG: hypothetical protein GON13_02930 [Nanoarchaeota archaeon]|nr:hypothetical protein [Nanoarchaeota archaeon]
MQVMFVTSNVSKFALAKRVLEKNGIGLLQTELDIREIQSDDIEEIAVDKAKKAFAILKKPLIVDDSCFVLKKFNTFPGAFSKYVLKSIGLSGIMKLVDDDRHCAFNSILVYIDDKCVRIFKLEDPGTVSFKISDVNLPEAWSDLWKIFIPEGYNNTVSDMNDVERNSYYSSFQEVTHYQKFADWFNSFSFSVNPNSEK